MPSKRPNEPIAPATIPGQALDPKIPPDDELELEGLPEDEEEDEDDVDEDDDIDDEDEEDDEDDDEDDDVGTDEDGKEILRADVSSDRVPATDAEPEGSLDRVKTAPLGIQEIERLEDDAKGG